MRQSVALRREDEVALAQSVDRMGPDLQAHRAPRQMDVRMVPLVFRQLAHAVRERQGAHEIRKLVALGQVVVRLGLPALQLPQERPDLLRRQRRDVSLTRHAVLLRELHATPPENSLPRWLAARTTRRAMLGG